MGKIAFLYPGQGSQKVGMGRQLLKVAPELFEKYLVQSNEVAKAPITQYCLEGPIELLSQTQIAQPALFAYSLALTEYAHRLGLYPDMVAGHSLGEYTAAVAGGALSFEDGLYLVSQRGKLMQEIQSLQPGAMAAVLGLAANTLSELCTSISSKHFVTVANQNSPKQLVVSGVESAVLELMNAVHGTGGRAIRLTAAGAFHSLLMAPAQKALSEIIQDLDWTNAYVPVVANVTGQSLVNAHKIRQELIEQITQPVNWVACVETLVASGCDTFVELGPIPLLSKLVHAIAPEVQTFWADAPEKIIELAEKQLTLDPLYG